MKINFLIGLSFGAILACGGDIGIARDKTQNDTNDAVQEPIGVYRQHSNQMQRKYFAIKSHQLNIWYNEILKNKTFGNEDNIKLFKEWKNFQKVLTYVKSKNYFKSIKEIMVYPNNKNKFKLLILLMLPEFISKNIINET